MAEHALNLSVPDAEAVAVSASLVYTATPGQPGTL